MVTVKANRRTRTIRLPLASRGLLAKGATFIFSQSGDTIFLKQVREKPWPAKTSHGIKRMSLREVDDVVHETRGKISGKGR